VAQAEAADHGARGARHATPEEGAMKRSLAAHESSSTSSVARRLEDLPGPRGWPLVGNALQLEPRRLHLILEGWAKEFGSPYQLRLGTQRVLVIADNEVFSDVLRDRPETFRRFSPMAAVIDELGASGVFSAEGERWRRQRKLVMHAMTPQVVQHFFPTLERATARLERRWRAAATTTGVPFNPARDLKRYALDITSALAFGTDTSSLERDDDPLQRDLEQFFGVVSRRTVAPFPYWRYLRLPQDRAADAMLARVHAAGVGFIALARQRLAADPARAAQPENMLEALVAARDAEGSGFTDDDVLGNVLTILAAGEDTTANTIAWLLIFLATNPEAAARVAAEADQHAADVRDFAALDHLDYLEAAAEEAMRLKPVATALFLEANVDAEVAGVQINAGTPVWGVLRPTALDLRHFPDAHAFRPERWLVADAARLDDPKRKVLAFGGGPRFCPGRYLAMVEIKMAVAMVARNFVVSLDAGAGAIEETFNFSMMPSHLPLRLRLREGADARAGEHEAASASRAS
jgi:cytochrome P450